MSILDFAENSLELRQCTWLMVEVTQCMSNAKCFFLQSLPAEVSMVGEKMGEKKTLSVVYHTSGLGFGLPISEL